jgi:RHS repeat-associated protein
LKKTIIGSASNYDQDYIGGIEYRTGVREAIYTAEGRVFYTSPTTPRYEYTIKDHLGNARLSFSDVNTNGTVDFATEVLQENHYYPFGLGFDGNWKNDAARDNRYQYNGKEINDDFGLNWNDYGARWLDAAIGRWWSVDLMTEKHFGLNPFNYTLNNPLKYADFFGMDTTKVLVIDQDSRPNDNGTQGDTYSADVFVYDTDTGELNGPYSGSSYPNSKSNNDNSTKFNTATEGSHDFNNVNGHKLGTKKGLNLVDSNSNRTTPGTDPSGNPITMYTVNVHAGASDNGNFNSRGSEGCITICPGTADNQSDSFFQNFDWSGNGGTTGTSAGIIEISRLSPNEKALKIQNLKERATQAKEDIYNPIY